MHLIMLSTKTNRSHLQPLIIKKGILEQIIKW